MPETGSPQPDPSPSQPDQPEPFDHVGPPPRTAAELHAWITEHLELVVPTRPLIDGHSSPFDYLRHAFFDGRPDGEESERHGDSEPATAVTDCLVWANRGGGKTFLAAVATLLDLVFKPTIEIRILAGSLDQARHMHDHLRGLLEGTDLCRLVEGRITEKRARLKNGSRVELLSQSQTSVRGTRVQKLRCDEVELFDQDVWEAAQLVTRSKRCGGLWVPGTIECLSTMHVPYGLMWRLVRDATADGPGGGGGEAESGERPRKLFKWGVIDVLGACGPGHACESCALEPDCQGRAKLRDELGEPEGHVTVEDALRLRSRVGDATWKAEMLSLRPRRSDCVLPEFDRSAHVVERVPEGAELVVAGVDFGIRAPTVVLWAFVDAEDVVRVAHERVASNVVLDRHIEALLRGDPEGAPAVKLPAPAWVGVDPAGRQRSGQTGISDVQAMRKAGLTVRDRRLGLGQGIELLRARLKPADGAPRLYVHRRCEKLIESMERYRYPSDRPECSEPVKDGSDHAVDALRYLVQNLDAGFSSAMQRY